MKYCLVLLLPFFLFLNSCEKYKGFTNKAEAKNELGNGVKEGKWVKYNDSNLNETSEATAYCYVLHTYLHGKIVSTSHSYYKSGKLRAEIPHENGKLMAS